MHSHQPVGNLDYVFEDIYQESYAPFIEAFRDRPDVPVSLHYSGPLLEWLEMHHPDYLDKIAAGVAEGQVEMVGGAFYEPILTLLPSRDRIDQILTMQQYMTSRFKVESSGFWLAERVWEQGLVADLADAGVRYTLVDHTHFNYGGFKGVPGGYYTAEDRGKLVYLFPINENLRYLIPFAEPAEVIAYLKTFLDRSVNEAIVIYADDGEKFGSWPGTQELVYKKKWLLRFMDALLENSDWLELTSFEKILREHPSNGLAYLPDASYREMMAWALEPEQQALLEGLHRKYKDKPELQAFLRGGSYRNFRKKYPESFLMYNRMLQLSEQVNTPAARQFLHRAQCNCAYWHGVFGGIYLPHLRNAVFENIIEGEQCLQEPAITTAVDMDMDGASEWIINTNDMKVILDPDCGGRLLSWDLKKQKTNIQSTFTRQPEYYHQYVTEHPRAEGMLGVHDIPVLKDPDLKKDLIYDCYQRLSLLDHRLKKVPSPEDIRYLQFQMEPDFIQRRLETEVLTDSLSFLDKRYGVNKQISVSENQLSVQYQCDTPQTFPFIVEPVYPFSRCPRQGLFFKRHVPGPCGCGTGAPGRPSPFSG